MNQQTEGKSPEEIAQELVRGAIKKKRESRFSSRLRRHFFAGLLVVTPLGLTIWIVSWLINLIDQTTREFVVRILKPWGMDYQFIPIGFGLLLAFVGICFIGMATSNFIGRKVVSTIDTTVRRLPGVSRIYNAVHQVSHAFLNRNKDVFTDVIFIEYPRLGIYSIGLVTNRTVSGVEVKGGERLKSVFIPTTPNPTSGYLLLIPDSQCIPCPMTVEESMKMIISGGVVVPESLTVEMTSLPLIDEVKSVGG